MTPGRSDAVLRVDAFKGGWVGVHLRYRRAPEVAAEQELSDLLARFADVAVIGIDMPIGLPKT